MRLADKAEAIVAASKTGIYAQNSGASNNSSHMSSAANNQPSVAEPGK